MTRQQFIETVTQWWELKEVCEDHGCPVCDEVYDEEGMDNEINYSVSEYAGDYSWYDLRDKLDDIPSGYDAYHASGSFDWEGLTPEDFDDYKNDVLDWMDDNGYWDEEEPEEEPRQPYENPFDDEEELPLEDAEEPFAPAEEAFSAMELFGMCSASLITIQQEKLRQEQEMKEAFRQYVNASLPKVLE